MSREHVCEIKGSRFPFGKIGDQGESGKMQVKKIINYKNQLEYRQIIEGIDKLKTISHKNSINLRSSEDDGKGTIELHYPYIASTLQDSLLSNPSQQVKNLHRQFIELAIYLAKHYVATSFNPKRCGAMTVDKKTVVKYYLPIGEIRISDNISLLERSVQLFNLQSMHYLDGLAQKALSSTHESSPQQSCQGKSTISTAEPRKMPQPLQFNSPRKFSTLLLHTKEMRKLSNLSKEMTQFSEMRKNRAKQPTHISAGSKSISGNYSIKPRSDLKNYASESKIINEQVLKLKERSMAAIKDFRVASKYMREQNSSLSILFKLIMH